MAQVPVFSGINLNTMEFVIVSPFTSTTIAELLVWRPARNEARWTAGP